ncbi:MAG: phospholipid ABC transporter ATP-binding protein MlaF [Coxiella sp. (in: Bacteria)]|nr:MAG: phospholipid ABC transporter ATP-binding protein MlaF [Coxiella sp. (in: g-proteobacteria)]
MDSEHAINISNLSFSRDEKEIFRGLNLSVARGKVTAIMGPSGTGKTTLLNIIGGQLKPDAGEVTIESINPYKIRKLELYHLRRKMGILFQEGGLFTDLNVYENIAFPLRQHTRLKEDMIRDLVLMNLQAVGLRGASKLRIDQLSGGMARRVAMARAIVLGPDIMLYDEPFTGQDPIGKGVLLQLIRTLNDALGLTTVLVSHDVHETATIADYTYILSEGGVIAEGESKALIKDTQPAVYQFIHGLADGPVSFEYPAQDFAEEVGV